MKFKKKPEVVDAFQLTSDNYHDVNSWPDWLHNIDDDRALIWYSGDADNKIAYLSSPHGLIKLSPNDWIVQDGIGVIRVKPIDFEMMYDPV